MTENFLGLMLYCIPALLTGAIAFLFFKEHVTNENNRRNFMLHKTYHKEILPTRLQAFERLTLFLERISAHNLLLRVPPIAPQPDAYKDLLIKTIEQEYEHNLAQQIYVSESCWQIISAAKNNSIKLIRSFEITEETPTANDMSAALFETLTQSKLSPQMALNVLKEELGLLLN